MVVSIIELPINNNQKKQVHVVEYMNLFIMGATYYLFHLFLK